LPTDLPNVDQHALHLQLSKVVLHVPHQQHAHKLGVALRLITRDRVQVHGCVGSKKELQGGT
jgi:hypothetical protein